MLKERIRTTNVEIPKLWEQLEDGRFKVDIPYEKNYGTINPESIPDCVVMMGSHHNSIILYANNQPIIPNGLCLTFTRK